MPSRTTKASLVLSDYPILLHCSQLKDAKIIHHRGEETMKARTILLTIALTLTACAAPPPSLPTDTPLPPTVPATDIPTLVSPSATLPLATATTVLAQPTSTATLAIAPTTVASTATSQPPVTGFNNPYAVILVSPDDVLNIRTGAGVANAIAGTLQPTALEVRRTGPASPADGARWVEIQSAAGNGWVNENFLTEQVASSTFCADPRVNTLLNNVKTAMLNSNGELLSSLVSPVHGLDARLWRYGTVANYTPEEAKWVFQSEYVVNWGPAPGSGAETPGTFSSQLLPKLKEVFGANYALHCNSTLDLATFSIDPWPREYSNINYYMVYKPGSEQYGGMDWRAWTVGVEYVQGTPMLFSLIHYQWEP